MCADGIAQAVDPALERLLRLDPDAQRRVAALQGHGLAIEITGLDRVLYLEPDGERLRVTAEASQQPAARITGSPASLARLAGAGGTRALFGGGLAVTGDVTVARAYKRLFDTLEPDWEEALARALGDSAGHQAGRLVRGASAWFQRARAGRADDLRAWLTDESEALPPRAEIERWFDAVDQLRHDGDRLAARVERLERVARERDAGES